MLCFIATPDPGGLDHPVEHFFSALPPTPSPRSLPDETSCSASCGTMMIPRIVLIPTYVMIYRLGCGDSMP
jgi:hypothetical protein